jgi:ribosomal protein S18 acetylase RimI-like enzyme
MVMMRVSLGSSSRQWTTHWLWGVVFLLSLRTNAGFSVIDGRQRPRLASWRNSVVSEREASCTISHGEDEIFFIRKCLPAEVGAAADILTDAFFKENTNFITYQWERLTTYLSLEGTYPRPGDRRVIFVACHATNGRVLGLAEIDDMPSKNPNDTPRPYMFNVAVGPKWRRKGIASALVLACEKFARTAWGKPQVYLKVRDTSKAAISMYESLGYTQRSARVERLNSKYQNLIVMSKDITI